MLLDGTLAVTVALLANFVAVLSSISHSVKENDEVGSGRELTVENVRKPFIIGGKHDVEQGDSTELEVIALFTFHFYLKLFTVNI